MRKNIPITRHKRQSVFGKVTVISLYIILKCLIDIKNVLFMGELAQRAENVT